MLISGRHVSHFRINQSLICRVRCWTFSTKSEAGIQAILDKRNCTNGWVLALAYFASQQWSYRIRIREHFSGVWLFRFDRNQTARLLVNEQLYTVYNLQYSRPKSTTSQHFAKANFDNSRKKSGKTNLPTPTGCLCATQQSKASVFVVIIPGFRQITMTVRFVRLKCYTPLRQPILWKKPLND